MGNSNTNRVTISLLCCTILLQGCTIYRKTPITLNEAAEGNKKVLVVRNNDHQFELRSVAIMDGKYYGTARVKGKLVQVPLDPSDIKTVRPLNRGASGWANAGLIAVPAIIVAALFFSDAFKWKESKNTESYF